MLVVRWQLTGHHVIAKIGTARSRGQRPTSWRALDHLAAERRWRRRAQCMLDHVMAGQHVRRENRRQLERVNWTDGDSDSDSGAAFNAAYFFISITDRQTMAW